MDGSPTSSVNTLLILFGLNMVLVEIKRFSFLTESRLPSD